MRRQAGFTLLEVLVAFVMLATVGTALFQLYQGGLRSLHSSEEQTHAALLARSQLSELRAVDRLSPGSYEGKLAGPYRWTLELTPFEENEEASAPLRPAPHHLTRQVRAQLFTAELRIEWGEPEGKKYYQVRTLLRAREEETS